MFDTYLFKLIKVIKACYEYPLQSVLHWIPWTTGLCPQTLLLAAPLLIRQLYLSPVTLGTGYPGRVPLPADQMLLGTTHSRLVTK